MSRFPSVKKFPFKSQKVIKRRRLGSGGGGPSVWEKRRDVSRVGTGGSPSSDTRRPRACSSPRSSRTSQAALGTGRKPGLGTSPDRVDPHTPKVKDSDSQVQPQEEQGSTMRQSRRCRCSRSLRLFLPEAQSRGTPRQESPPPGWTRSHLPPALAPGGDFLPLAVAPPKGFTVTFPCHRCYWREALWPAPGRRQGPASLLPFPEPLETGKTWSRSCSRCRCADHRAPVRLDPETLSPAQEGKRTPFPLNRAVFSPADFDGLGDGGVTFTSVPPPGAGRKFPGRRPALNFAGALPWGAAVIFGNPWC
ncbi:uncharacterized protein [Equus przewalskii]|uniref:Uncharacterized protein n=1 Tax=Equus przewalskii TaxID=9798 RepID=A0ABM4LL54_EQUPR